MHGKVGPSGRWSMRRGLPRSCSRIMCCVVARRHPAKRASGPSHAGRAARPALRHGAVHRLGGDVLRRLLLGLLRRSALLSRTAATGGVWPPKGIHPFDPFDLPFLNTLILLLSGTTVTWAHHALLEGNASGRWCAASALTVILGLCFTCSRPTSTATPPSASRDGIYPSTFFMATGFHGFHVHRRHDLPARLPVPRAAPASSRPTTISASRRRPGTGTSSTWSGCSSSSASTGGAAERSAPIVWRQ